MFEALLMLAEAGPFLGDKGLAFIGAGIGVAILVFGAAKGIAHIAASAVQSIARQPEAGGRIFTSMIISAAFIEGFTFFALVIFFLGLGKVTF